MKPLETTAFFKLSLPGTINDNSNSVGVNFCHFRGYLIAEVEVKPFVFIGKGLAMRQIFERVVYGFEHCVIVTQPPPYRISHLRQWRSSVDKTCQN